MTTIWSSSPSQCRRVIDTSLPAGEEIVEEASAEHVKATSYLVNPRSLVVLVR